jgi:hypothetical protein
MVRGYQCFGEDGCITFRVEAYPEDGGGRYSLSGVTTHMIKMYIFIAVEARNLNMNIHF